MDEYVFLSSQDCDLTNYWQTKRLFDEIQPNCVIHLAACVGGLFKNMNQKVEMFEKTETQPYIMNAIIERNEKIDRQEKDWNDNKRRSEWFKIFVF